MNAAQSDQVPAPLEGELAAMEQLPDTAVLVDEDLVRRRGVLAQRLDGVLYGADSVPGKFEQRMNKVAGLIAQQAGKPFQAVLSVRHDVLVQRRENFDIGPTFDNELKSLELACDFARLAVETRAKLQGHPNAAIGLPAIGTVDELLSKLSLAAFNNEVQKINEPLRKAMHHAK